MLDRSIPSREALVHSIQISEVIDMKTEVLQALKGSLSEEKKLCTSFEALLSLKSSNNFRG
jgi:hypothetical protein